MEHAIEVRSLNKQYAGFSLRDVSFTVPTGYITGFIGPNGAGKTTTLKAILNLVRVSTGDIRLFGVDSRPGCESIFQQVGVVMDSPFYVEDWTMRAVEAAVAPFYKSWSHDAYRRHLRDFGIAWEKKVEDLSRGMKVKLMLAAALAHDAKLLILDEPTSGLDPVARDELCTLLGEFVEQEGRSVLFSTHITSDLEKIADYIIFILDGRVIFSGAKEELLEQYVLVKGGPMDLSTEARPLLMGLRQHPTGFEGMARRADLCKLPKHLLAEPVSLEEIIIFMNKGAKEHA